MNQAQKLITEIEKAGASIGLDTDCATLRIEAPRGTLTSEQKDELAKHKQDIIRMLKNRPGNPCQGCPHHDTGPDSFGTGVIHWCGPWEEPSGERWWNISELMACPKGKWGSVSKTVH
ncbi:MAG: hypothetical protein C4B58_05290 [Deltaproteobacteria bacterium]|nr:MAG: hypothetical protein C4B58_05290 [Deltaproteobacteria bacterium]